MTVTERRHLYPSSTPAEARQSLIDLQRRCDRGLIPINEYLTIRRRLVRAALAHRDSVATPLHTAVRGVDWEGTWKEVFTPLKEAR